MVQAKRVFQTMKRALTSSPVLRNSDFDQPLLVQTDALVTGLGAVLLQEFDKEHLIVFCKVPVYQLDDQGTAVHCDGHPFMLVTDYAPLQWIARVKDTNSRITQLFLALQDFTFQVKHGAGAMTMRIACPAAIPVGSVSGQAWAQS